MNEIKHLDADNPVAKMYTDVVLSIFAVIAIFVMLAYETGEIPMVIVSFVFLVIIFLKNLKDGNITIADPSMSSLIMFRAHERVLICRQYYDVAGRLYLRLDGNVVPLPDDLHSIIAYGQRISNNNVFSPTGMLLPKKYEFSFIDITDEVYDRIIEILPDFERIS